MESHLLFGLPHYFQVLNPNAARLKGGLPSVVTHLNAKDAFLPSSLSFFTLISLASSIFLTSFHFTVSLFHLPCFPPTIPFLFCSASSLSQLPLVFSLQCQSESKNHLHILYDTFAIHSASPTRVLGDKRHTESRFLLYCGIEVMKLYLTKVFCICVMKHVNEVRS